VDTPGREDFVKRLQNIAKFALSTFGALYKREAGTKIDFVSAAWFFRKYESDAADSGNRR
jgi:hypothetical protein